MSVETASLPQVRRPGLTARLLGLGSVYGKSIRDGRRTALGVGVAIGMLMLVGAAVMAAEWNTLEKRVAFAAQMQALPEVLQGLLGEPIGLETLGGFLSWRFGNILPVMLGLWSVLAMSSTLAGEARRGTLDLVAAAPITRRRIAIQKAAAHATLVAVAMLLGAVLTWLGTIAFAVLPGDEVSLVATIGHFTLTGLLMLASGAAAFAASPLLGRGRALAVGMLVLFGGFLVEGYGGTVPALEALRPVSIFSWTAGHRPLAGLTDWAPVAGVAIVAVVLFGIGVTSFARRDIGITTGAGPIHLPSLPAGTGGPLRRQLADRLGGSLAWGLGIGLYAFVIALSAEGFAEAVGSSPQLQQMIDLIFPGIDIAEPSGIIQIVFFTFGSLMVGLAAAVMIGGWATDEGDRRLEVVLAAPLSRTAWALRSGAGALIAIALVSTLIGASIALGIASQGGDVGEVAGATGVLALFGTAFGAMGLAVGGVFGSRFAAPAVGGLVLASFLLELLGVALKLPDWLVDLSLNGHLGQPLLGTYDTAGLVATALLTVGGLAVGAWGFARRDIGS